MHCHSNSFVANKMLFLFVWRIFSLTSVFRTCILVWMSELPWNRIVYFLESLVLFLVPNLLSSNVNSSWVPVMQGLDLCCRPTLVQPASWTFYCGFTVSWFGSFHFVPSVCSLRLRTLSHCPRCACNCLLEHLIMVASDLLGKPGVCHPPVGYLFCVLTLWFLICWSDVLKLGHFQIVFWDCMLCKPCVCTAVVWPCLVRIVGVFCYWQQIQSRFPTQPLLTGREKGASYYCWVHMRVLPCNLHCCHWGWVRVCLSTRSLHSHYPAGTFCLLCAYSGYQGSTLDPGWWEWSSFGSLWLQ